MEVAEKLYLDDAGAYVYLITTDFGLDSRLIGLGEHFTRLGCLLAMLEPHSELYPYVAARLGQSETDRSIGWPQEPAGDTSEIIPELEVYEDVDEAARPNVMRFMTNRAGILGEKWVFNKGDPDFFPSVPHGHLKNRLPIKLDAYRGYTYDTAHANTPCARETRTFIVGLWRDSKFRRLAYEAVRHFIQINPSFNWLHQRGIVSPLRFPK
jgi:hypothetical protein